MNAKMPSACQAESTARRPALRVWMTVRSIPRDPGLSPCTSISGRFPDLGVRAEAAPSRQSASGRMQICSPITVTRSCGNCPLPFYLSAQGKHRMLSIVMHYIGIIAYCAEKCKYFRYFVYYCQISALSAPLFH